MQSLPLAALVYALQTFSPTIFPFRRANRPGRSSEEHANYAVIRARLPQVSLSEGHVAAPLPAPSLVEAKPLKISVTS
jgi:hypothetical protein